MDQHESVPSRRKQSGAKCPNRAVAAGVELRSGDRAGQSQVFREPVPSGTAAKRRRPRAAVPSAGLAAIEYLLVTRCRGCLVEAGYPALYRAIAEK
uniref:Transposase n=1 Tax=Parastrongyloides trichosuri TaxID=131310 RepID=A0A0N4Z3E8_PARTI